MRRQVLGSLQRLVNSGSSCLPATASSQSSAATSFCRALAVRGFADDATLLKTPLNDFHIAHGGKMVPFAGWSMPLQYKDSIVESTKHARKGAALFDVSHMCGLTLRGEHVVQFLERLTPADVAALPVGTGQLTVFTNEAGGIIDDSVITKVNEHEIYLVLNAGCRQKDLEHLGKQIRDFQGSGQDCAMLPLMKEDLSKFYFGQFLHTEVAGKPSYITRSGYTGEDGFEISTGAEYAVDMAEAFMKSDQVRLTGLGARDQLRLEAGLCLYGNDLNEEISPVEAGLTWCIGKRRRAECDFLGGERIKGELENGASIKRIGLISEGAPSRQHSELLTRDGQKIGEVTSGAFSPNLGKNIAMGYVKKEHSKAGTELYVVVRGKRNKATITKMPFVPAHYYKK
ncbi:hypothetical protein WJX72_001715 [[Myrmecia] bisecta]|uniref:Aminomethyltransferase n=1 Tax=[Myrmecia] bisecta TaxID=41462 RepID=A0AAW1Q886_9CHLO